MAQINVDPQKLREFAGRLNRFAAQVDEHTAAIKSNITRLGDTWRDQEFERFVNEFALAQHYLTQFSEEARRNVPLLERDAEKIEEFLRMRP